jgi:hypothetical protein
MERLRRESIGTIINLGQRLSPIALLKAGASRPATT